MSACTLLVNLAPLPARGRGWVRGRRALHQTLEGFPLNNGKRNEAIPEAC